MIKILIIVTAVNVPEISSNDLLLDPDCFFFTFIFFKWRCLPTSILKGSSNNKAPHQEQELAEENKQSNTITAESNAGAVEQKDEQRLDVMMLQDEPIKQTEEHQAQELPNALAETHHNPVHQGQPEI